MTQPRLRPDIRFRPDCEEHSDDRTRFANDYRGGPPDDRL
jgi:hypothetical protein